MSTSQRSIWAPSPSTTRGVAVKLGTDPKGEKLVYTNGRCVFIRDIKNPSATVAYTQHTQPTTVAKLSPSGYYCASGDVAGNIRIWDTLGSEQILKLETRPISGKINDLAWDGESKRIIAVGDGKERFGHAFLFDSGSSVGEITGHSKVVNGVAIRSQRPFRAVTAADDNTLVFFNGVPFKFSKVIRTHTRFVQSVEYSPNGSHFASAGSDSKVFLYDGKEGDTLGELKDGNGSAHDGTTYAVSWKGGNEGRELATSGADGVVKIWDVERKEVTGFWSINEGGTAVANQQMGNVWVGDSVASLSLSGNINIIDPRTPGKPASVLYGPQKSITAFARSPSDTFYAGSYDGRTSFFSSDGTCSPVGGSGHVNQVVAMATPAKGDKVFTAGMDDSVKLVEGRNFSPSSATTGSLPKGLSADVNGTVFVAAGSEVQVLKDTKKISSVPLGFAGSAIAVNAEGQDVAVGAEDAKVHLFKFDGSSLQKNGTLDANRTAITALSFSPDGSLLAAGETSGKIILYDVKVKELKTAKWVFHTARISSIAWSPQGTHAASGSLDTNVYVWSVAKPMKNIAIKNAHVGGVTGVQWVDGETLATAGSDATVKTFSIAHHPV